MMQEGTEELLRFQNLTTDTLQVVQSILAEDMLLIRDVPPTEVQEWCLARIAGYQGQSRRLRESYGPAARSIISKIKSHVRALRSECNAFAPINRVLPPEMLMEIFANIDQAVYQRGVPVLRVCGYWRMLLVKVPRFWANLLSLPVSRSTNSNWRIERFRAALSLSAPLTLTLSLPFWSLDVVDTLIPHATRLGSLTISPPRDIGSIKRLLEQDMPCLRDIIVLPHPQRSDPLSPLSLNFLRYPNLQRLKLGHGLTVYYSPIMPCPSLHHLQLTHCTMQAEPSSAGSIGSVQSVHDMLALFPNLKTLSVTHALCEGDWSEDLPAGSTTVSVHLPRLILLEIEDMPIYIPHFLSRLVFPPTTVLVFKLDHRLVFEDPLPPPVSPDINPAPSPDAELSIYLDFLYFSGTSLLPEGHARWETHGTGARPVHVTLTTAAQCLDPVAHLTRELALALAPPPARGVTSLTTRGTWVRSPPGDEHPYLIPSPQEYWTAFLPELAGLRRITCEDCDSARDIIGVLGQRTPPRDGVSGGGEFLCPRLAELALVWDVPTAACFEMGQDGPESRRARAGENSALDEGNEEGPGSARAVHGAGSSSQSEVEVGPAFAAALGELCEALGACFAERAGRCEPIRTLSVAPRGAFGWDLRVEGWQAALVERRLRDRLEQLVGEVLVVDKVECAMWSEGAD